MSRFHGPSFKGAARTVREFKRNEAEARNAKTRRHRRRKARLARQAAQ